jgi:hypothetical protein
METPLLDRVVEFANDPELAADVLWGLSAFGGKTFREELSHHLQQQDIHERRRIRDLALLIAGACGEAE